MKRHSVSSWARIRQGRSSPPGAVRRLFTEENRGLRMAQGAAVLSFLFCLTGLGMFGLCREGFPP